MQRRSLILIVILFLLLLPTLCTGEEIIRSTLDNGMRVVLREDHAAPVAAFQVWVEAGSVDERPVEEGMAHLIEHMIFKGTNEMRAGDLAGTIERYGGRINAYTSYEYTVYHVVIASRYQGKGLEVLADAIQHPSFDPTELTREKEVVIEEIRMGQDDPGRTLHKALFKNSFQRHPYGRPIIGYEDTVRGFGRKQVLGYYSKWYVPNNMVFVGVGDFNAAELLPRLTTLFTAPARHLPARHRPSEPFQKSFRRLTMQENVHERYFALGFHIPSVQNKEIFALDLLAAILGQGESSRLQQELRLKRGVTSSIYAYAFTPKDPGLFVIGGTFQPGAIQEGIEGIISELSRVKDTGVTEEELTKAKVMLEADFTYDRETVQGEAGKLGYFEVVMGDAAKEREYLQGIAKVGVQEIREAAKRYLRLENLTLCLLLPEEEKETIDPRTVEGLEKTSATHEMKEEMKRAVLENGITLLFQEDHSVPVVGICGVFLGGLRFEKEQKAGLTHFLSEMLTRGTKSYTTLQLAQKVDSLGATLETFSGRNSFGVQAKGLSRDFPQLVRLVAEVISKPSFPPEEVEKVRREVLTALGAERDQLIPRTMRLLRETLYERHPYRLNVLGTEGTTERIGRRDLLRYYKRYARPQNLVLAIVGDTKWEEVMGSVQGAFHEMRTGGFSPPTIPQEATEKKEIKKREEQVGEKLQTHIALGFAGTTLQDQDRFPLEVLEAALDGQGGRFFTELRDKEGLAYVTSFFVRSDLDPGYLGVYLATSPPKVEQALEGIERILKEVRYKGITQEELGRAKAYLIGNYAIGLQGTLALASTMAFDERYGLGGDFCRRYPSEIEGVTEADVLRVARKYIDLDSYAVVILRPSSP
ncbi:MAG: pitrilysin family protein [Deltaproteobacteria bacterium]|jgi:zinc protease